MIDFRFGIAEAESANYSDSKTLKVQVNQENPVTSQDDSEQTESLTTKANLWPWQTW